jgi:hypothetical protein
MIAHPDHGKIDAENVDLREQLFRVKLPAHRYPICLSFL